MAAPLCEIKTSRPVATTTGTMIVAGWGASTTLSPQDYVPKRELWLWKNPTALASVRRGLRQAAAGEVVLRESYAAYADLDPDE